MSNNTTDHKQASFFDRLLPVIETPAHKKENFFMRKLNRLKAIINDGHTALKNKGKGHSWLGVIFIALSIMWKLFMFFMTFLWSFALFRIRIMFERLFMIPMGWLFIWIELMIYEAIWRDLIKREFITPFIQKHEWAQILHDAIVSGFQASTDWIIGLF